MRFVRAVSICAVVVVGAVAQPAAAQVKVFNYEVLGNAYSVTNPPPLGPVTIIGARNGTFSGAVAVESTGAIKNLRAKVSALSAGGAVIPADRVLVRYAASWERNKKLPGGLDILLESPPGEIAAYKNRALAGVWVTVTVPDDAKAGLYRGQLTVQADGLPPRTAPIELTVADWRVPEPQDWKTWIEMIQSPDTLSLEYEVPLWSDRHWAMIAKSFQLISTTVLRNTNQGNAESMIRWVRGKDGSLKPDYSVMDKYLDLACENLGQPKLVVFYVWDAYLVLKHRKTSFLQRPTEPGPLQRYADPASRAIWKPVYDELRRRMKRRGLADAMVLAMVTDLEPSPEEVKFLQDVTGNLSWIAHSHYRRTFKKPSPNKVLHRMADVRYEAHAYNLVYHVNPDKGSIKGWQSPQLRTYVDRFGLLNGPALRIRQMPQLNITGQQRGIGRTGGDLWHVIRDKRGNRVGKVFDRYPENHYRGLNIASYFLAPGPEGPVATARLENLREGVQECEARIFIEEALADPTRARRLGPDLVKRARAALDAHQRAMWRSFWSDTEQLAKLGAISGRSMYEGLWHGLTEAGVKMPGFWESSARRLRSDEQRKGLDWFVAGSQWQQLNKQLFEVAADVQKRRK